MLKAVLVDRKADDLQRLAKKIRSYCPSISIVSRINDIESLHHFFAEDTPDLLFLGIDSPEQENSISILNNLPTMDCESIIVTTKRDHACDAIKHNVSGFVLKPVILEELIIAVDNAKKRILIKEENRKNKKLIQKIFHQMAASDKIGIPTIDGFDIFQINEIVRCEGLQRCTRIFTKNRKHLISSYNIGEFRKLLEPYGFYTPHKSHLINLGFVKRYQRSGSIIMFDDSSIPISRSRKTDFLKHIIHV